MHAANHRHDNVSDQPDMTAAGVKHVITNISSRGYCECQEQELQRKLEALRSNIDTVANAKPMASVSDCFWG